MRPDDIRALLRRQPFRAFRLTLTNSIVHEVRHPELVAVLRSMIQLGSPAGGSQGFLAEGVVGIALIHIVQYELLPSLVAPSTN
jgi:hypothetical protein